MAWTRNAWNNFKTQPEIWFFYGFILTSPLSIRKVFFDYPILGEFNEYSGIYLYLSDIFLGLVIAAWVILILYNKNYELSISKSLPVPPQKEISTPVGMFHGEHPTGQTWNFLRGRRGTKVIILGLPALLVLWSFITINWSGQPQIALYRSFKLFEFYLLYLFLALNPKCSMWNILRNAICIIIAVGLINAIVGILQVIIQHSLGLFWLKESLVSPDLPGVAKIVLGGAKYIRAYGLFPHPNILGGFLFLSIVLTLVYWRLFHPSTNVPRPPRLAETACRREAGGTLCGGGAEHPTSQLHKNYGLNGSLLLGSILAIQIVGGMLTFSKSAILGLILALVYIFRHWEVKMFHPSTNIPPQKEYSTPVRMFHVEHLTGQAWNTLRGRRGTIKKAFFLAMIIGLVIYSIRPDFGSIFIKSLTERLVYISISLNMISGNLLAGIGSGQFVLEMQRYSQEALLGWQFQPVHNVFLLIWSELGLVGLGLFIWFLWKLFPVKQGEQGPESKNVPRGTTGPKLNVQSVFKACLIGFFLIALFDHYLWDIQQGQIMLWTALGLLAGKKFTT